MSKRNRDQIGDRHHYVPKFLLRNFGFGKKRNKRVFVFDKASGNSYPASVNDAAHECGYNDIALPDGKIFPLEPVFAKADGDAVGAFQRLVETKSVPGRNTHDRDTLAEFIAVLHLRGPNNRRLHECLNQLMLEESGPDPLNQWIGDENYTPQQAAFESTVAMVEMVPMIKESIAAKAWVMYEAIGNARFCISDNPVALTSSLQTDHQSPIGFDVEGIEIYLPVSSRLTLFMMCPSVARKHSEIANFAAALKSGSPLRCDDPGVLIGNHLQVAFSERFLYQDSADFRFARELLNLYPKLVRGPRFVSGSEGT